jgi:hypothetical protein
MAPPEKNRRQRDFRRHPAATYRPPAYFRNLKTTLWSVIALAAAAILYVVFWFVIAFGLRNEAVVWAETRRQEGYTVNYSGLLLSGFPFLMRLTLSDPVLGYPASGIPWAWQSEGLTVEMRPWNPWRMTIMPTGALTLGLTIGGEPVTYVGLADEIAIGLGLAGGLPKSGELTVSGLNLSLADENGDSGESIAVKTMRLQALHDTTDDADHRTVTFDLHLQAEGLETPAGIFLPLGNRVDNLVLDASVLGAIPAGRLPESLAAWRDRGGTVEVPRLEFIYGPLIARAEGTLALDGDMQPIGAFTAKFQGFFEIIDALRKQGLIRSVDAITAKVVLGALARRPKDGGPASLNLAITLQNRKVFAGPVSLLKLPAIDWNELFPAE